MTPTTRTQRIHVPLFQPTLQKFELLDLVSEERRRCSTVADELSRINANAFVVAHYVALVGRHADIEVRGSSLLQNRERVPFDRLADSTTSLGMAQFFEERTLKLREWHQKFVDETNHYADEQLTEEQEREKRFLTNALEHAATFDTVLHVMRGVEQSPYDRVTRESMQAAFFVALTHSPTLREIVCASTSKLRMASHVAFGPPPLVHRFFKRLAAQTEQYVMFHIDETEYIRNVHMLVRIGDVLQPHK